MNKKIIFMGTPEFAVPILEMLINNYDVVAVVCQPDKIVGRHHEVVYSPVKKLAMENNIKVFQPIRINDEYKNFLDLNPDMIVTCAYGQIISKVILDNPKYGCINVHASLLPKLRGGAPIQHAIIDGYKKTGITIMYMAPGMDDGDIIAQEEYTINNNDTLGSLNRLLSFMVSKLLFQTLPSVFNCKNTRIKQNESDVTFAHIIKRDEEHLNFHESCEKIDCLVRGLNPYPYANVLINNVEYKIISGHYHKGESLSNKINIINKNELGIGCLDGIYYIDEIKQSGKKQMLIKDFLNGINKEEYKDYLIM